MSNNIIDVLFLQLSIFQHAIFYPSILNSTQKRVQRTRRMHVVDIDITIKLEFTHITSNVDIKIVSILYATKLVLAWLSPLAQTFIMCT